MSLANLIRKRETGKPANDNPAKAANDGRASGEPLAGLATLALANPIEPKPAKPAQVGAGGTATAPMTAEEEAAIRAWLALIYEADPATIAEVIGKCQRDAEARDYFTWQAAELPKPATFPDDRRTCQQCANLIARRCQVAKRGEIAASRDYEPIRDLPRRCEGYAPGPEDADERLGLERWPGLIQEGDE